MEFGVIAPQGPAHLARLGWTVAESGSGLPEAVHESGGIFLKLIAGLYTKIRELERRLRARED